MGGSWHSEPTCRDPLADIGAAIHGVRSVMKGGKRVVDRTGAK
jgi:hypothetical protein